MIEVPIARVQCEIVLQHERRQPHVVRRYWRSLLAELTIDGRVVMSRLIVRIQDVDAIFE